MISNKIIKVCGMREGKNIREVEESGVDLIGLIFYPGSSRYISVIPDYLPSNKKRVGVFVNETQHTVSTIRQQFLLNYIQLHGEESPEYCRKFRGLEGLSVIKSFSISGKEDLKMTEAYEGCCDFFLFDTKCPGYGGSGKQFDWNVLTHYTGNTPFLLSGGIAPGSIGQIKEFNHQKLAGYDLNSKFETTPEKKNIQLIKKFMDDLSTSENK